MALLLVHLVPNAKIDRVAGEHGGRVKIKLRAPALEGKANVALVHFLAKQLELPPHAIVLKRGYGSRDKLIRIDGLTLEGARTRMCGRE